MISFYTQLCWAALAVLALLMICCAVRAVRGPQAADRLVAVNMMTTLVTIGICLFAFLLGEDYLADVAIIFSLLGCMAVVVLTRVLLSHALEKRKGKDSASSKGRKGAAGHVE